jgi:hypothetical protein
MYSTFSGFVMDIYSRLWIDMTRLILSELCCQEICWTLLDIAGQFFSSSSLGHLSPVIFLHYGR